MKKPIKVFEPITAEQIKMLHSAPFEGGTKRLYDRVEELIGIASITALSKQEAIFLIDQLKGKNRFRYPKRPPWEYEIEADLGGDLPSYYHIRDIRLIFKKLGWTKDHIKNWLLKYSKVKDIRSMSRDRAQKTYFALQKMTERERAKRGDI